MFGKRIVAVMAVMAMLLFAWPGPDAGAAGSAAASGEPVGGRKHFICAMSATLVVIGMVTFQPEAVLIGNIVGGIACGLGQ
jgi:hypothetical protein